MKRLAERTLLYVGAGMMVASAFVILATIVIKGQDNLLVPMAMTMMFIASALIAASEKLKGLVSHDSRVMMILSAGLAAASWLASLLVNYNRG